MYFACVLVVIRNWCSFQPFEAVDKLLTHPEYQYSSIKHDSEHGSALYWLVAE